MSLSTGVFMRIDNDEVLRYAGSEPDPVTLADINRLKPMLENIRPRHVCSRFSVESTDAGVSIAGMILTGEDIRGFLGDSCECWLLSATLGIEADRIIARVQKKSAGDGLIIDAIASAAIEAYCDEVQAGISDGLRRYSCGYGDLPIGLQPAFLSALDAQRAIGLYCNRENVMIPRKSVTAVIANANILDNCRNCKIKSECERRKAGDYCGH